MKVHRFQFKSSLIGTFVVESWVKISSISWNHHLQEVYYTIIWKVGHGWGMPERWHNPPLPPKNLKSPPDQQLVGVLDLIYGWLTVYHICFSKDLCLGACLMVHGELGHGVVQLEDMILNLLWLDFIAWRGLVGLGKSAHTSIFTCSCC